MAPQVFAVPVFFIVFRESLETVIIVSVLLAWLKQTLGGPNSADAALHKRLRRQVWLGVGLGGAICLVVAATVIGIFYTVGVNHWSTSEAYYEGAFALFASLIITVVGAAMLRVSKMQDKWRAKLIAALEGRDPVVKGGSRIAWLGRFSEKYAMFALPFITVLREGIEATVFVAGVTFSAPASAFPLPVVVGLAVGTLAGYILYKGGSTAQMQIFLVASTCLLYLVAAGLFSRAVGYFEQAEWNKVIGGDAAELGTGPGTYDIDRAVWHVNCCSPTFNGGSGWGIFNAILGWNNTATYGSVIAYNVYWIVVIAGFFLMRFKETHGRYPLLRAPAAEPPKQHVVGGSAGSTSSVSRSEEDARETRVTATVAAK